MAPHSSTVAWKNPMDRGAWKAAVHEVTKSRIQLSDFTFTFHFHALEKEMATHSSVVAWRIPWTEKPGRLQSMGSHRVGHDWSDLAAESSHSISFQASDFDKQLLSLSLSSVFIYLFIFLMFKLGLFFLFFIF